MSKFDKLCETVGLEKLSLSYPDLDCGENLFGAMQGCIPNN